MTLHAPPWSGRLVSVVAIVAVVLLAALVLLRINRVPRTQDAFLYADSTAIAPEVSGRVVAFLVKENQRVTKGQTLVELDPEPFDLQLAQSRAQAAALRAQIGLTTRQVASQSTGVAAAETQIKSARSQLALAQDSLARLAPLVKKGYVTPQQVDQARTNEKVAQAALTSAVQEAQAKREEVGDTASLRAQLEAAEAAVALAERNRRYATVQAPFDGWVVGLQVSVGTYATTGHPLFTLVRADEWYAVGNFRETELSSIRAGDAATVWLLGAGNRSLRGHVDSIGRGVQPESVGTPGPENTGAPGLPAVGRTLNWVVIAQRFPVRIRLDEAPPELTRIGATATIQVFNNASR
jgi:multidrug efflux system membrane fusion protein